MDQRDVIQLKVCYKNNFSHFIFFIHILSLIMTNLPDIVTLNYHYKVDVGSYNWLEYCKMGD